MSEEKVIITGKMFSKWEELEASGLTDMTNYVKVLEHMDITRAEHVYIICNYGLLKTKHEYHIL
jgi:hypothetical protein